MARLPSQLLDQSRYYWPTVSDPQALPLASLLADNHCGVERWFHIEREAAVETKDILTTAKQAVDDAQVPEPLQETAFAKAVDLIAGRTSSMDSSSRADVPKETLPKAKGTGTAPTMLESIAFRLKLDREIVEEVYFERNGELEITVSPAKLGASLKAGTQELALLVTAGRQASDEEDYTSVEEIRKVAEEFRKYDSDNFSRAINDMSKEFRFRGGPRSRELRVSKPGWEEATKLVQRLAGEGN